MAKEVVKELKTFVLVCEEEGKRWNIKGKDIIAAIMEQKRVDSDFGANFNMISQRYKGYKVQISNE